MKTAKEFIGTSGTMEKWCHRYNFESWVTPIPLKDIRTNKVYPSNSLIFCLISYLDDQNNFKYVNEAQYFKPLDD